MRKHKYVCGYLGERQIIYGIGNDYTVKGKNWTDPMTLYQAKQYIKKVNTQWNLKGKNKMVIFELVVINQE